MAKSPRRDEDVLRLKVTLAGVRPPIWRRLEVPGSMTLSALHDAIQAVMGWGGFHLYAFDVGGTQYGDPTQVDDVNSDERLTVGGIAKSGVTWFLYVYDFGDDWQHRIAIEGKFPRLDGRRYPACTGGKRSSPPEDCGGPWGYQDLLAALADPSDPRRDELLEFVEDGFDPDAFSVEIANAGLHARFE